MSGTVEPLQVVSERRFTAEVPANVNKDLVDPENVFATTKEEEWIKKKKKELTTTRQIETRVKRQVVLEDGKVVDDSGPIVTTNTTEDTETQEHQQTEHRTTGDDPPSPEAGYVAVARPDGLLKEVKEKTVTTHEEKEERVETENVEHMGDLSDQDYISAICQKQDVRSVLLANRDGEDNRRLVKTEPRIVHQSSKSHKIIDTTDSHEAKELHPDGKIVTETKKTTEREEIHETDDPREEGDPSDEDKEVTKESSFNLTKTKDEDFVEYVVDGVKVGKEMRYFAENVEGERKGDPTMMDQDWESLSTRIRKMRRDRAKLQTNGAANGLHGAVGAAISPLDRKDALTKKPVDFDQEEETRKVETSKWLEHHFGSDSRSSKESLGDSDLVPPARNNTSFINVTMKSRPITSKNNAATSTSPVNGYSPGGHSSRVYVSSPEPQEISQTSYRVVRNSSHWNDRVNGQVGEDEVDFIAPKKPERVQVYPPLTKDIPINKSSEKLRSQHSSNGNLDRIPEEQRNGDTVVYSTVRKIPPPEFPTGSSSRTSPPFHGTNSPVNNNKFSYDDDEKCPSPPPRRKYNERIEMREERHRSHSRNQNNHSSKDVERDEPSPDYSPTPPENRQNTPSPENTTKKVYERTRFAADIPPASSRRSVHHNNNNNNNNNAKSQSTTSIIGESIRKLVGKLRSSSSERKNKRRGRSPSPSPTYQQYHVIDNNIPDVESSRDGSHNQRNMDRRKVVQRYYLGEDPFGGSIYGREKEYDGVVPARSSRRHHKQDSDESRLHNSSYLSKSTSRLARNDSKVVREPSPVIDYSRTSQTLPRKLYEKKHVSIQRSADSSHWDSKLSRSSKPNSSSLINISFVNNVTPSTSSFSGNRTSPSSGPAKPVRTYKSNLARSKSFNVHGLDSGDSDLHAEWKSNPQLHRLTDSPPPLKSPGILASISRSQRDLTRSPVTDQISSSYTKPYSSSSNNLFSNGYKNSSNDYKSISNGYKNSSNDYKSISNGYKNSSNDYKSISNGYRSSSNDYKSTSNDYKSTSSNYKSATQANDTKRRLFMKELKEQAPELYKTLHGDEIRTKSPLGSPISNSTPLKSDSPTNRKLDYKSSFRLQDSDSGRDSPFKSSYMNGTTSPVNYTTTLNHTPSYQNHNGTTKSIMRKGSPSNDDFSETVRITSKSDDPDRPSITNTVKSFSKKTIPRNGGVSTETIESSETTTTTKSRYKGDRYGLRNGSPGGVVIEVRPTRR